MKDESNYLITTAPIPVPLASLEGRVQLPEFRTLSRGSHQLARREGGEIPVPLLEEGLKGGRTVRERLDCCCGRRTTAAAALARGRAGARDAKREEAYWHGAGVCDRQLRGP